MSVHEFGIPVVTQKQARNNEVKISTFYIEINKISLTIFDKLCPIKSHTTIGLPVVLSADTEQTKSCNLPYVLPQCLLVRFVLAHLYCKVCFEHFIYSI